MILAALVVFVGVAQTGTASAKTEQARLVAQTSTGTIQKVAVTPDGRRALALENVDFIRIWDLASGREWRRLRPPMAARDEDRSANTFYNFDILSNGTEVVAYTPYGVLIYNLEAGTLRRRCGGDTLLPTRDVWPSPRGTEIAYATREGFAFLDLKSCRSRDRVRLGANVEKVAWNGDGQWLVASVVNGEKASTLYVWHKSGGARQPPIDIASQVTSLSMSRDGQVAAGSADGTIAIFRVNGNTLSPVRTLKQKAAVVSLQWSPDGSQLLTVGADTSSLTSNQPTGSLRVWNVKAAVESGPENSFTISSATWSPDGRTIIAASGIAEFGDSRTVVVNVADFKTQTRLSGTTKPIASALFADDGIIAGFEDGSVRVWPKTGDSYLQKTPLPPKQYAKQVRAISNTMVAAETSGPRLYVWDRSKSEAATSLAVGGQPIAWSRDGKRLLIDTSINGTRAAVWDVERKVPICSVQSGGPARVGAIALSDDGRRLITNRNNDVRRTSPLDRDFISPDYQAHVWDVDSCSVTASFLSPTGSVRQSGFSPDGRLFYMADSSYVHVWDASVPWSSPKFIVKQSDVEAVTFAPDSRTFATVRSEDGRLALWSAADGRSMGSFPSPPIARTHTVRFSPDGRFILTASAEGSLTLYRTDTRAQLATMVSFSDGSWAVVDPLGRYDALDPQRSIGLHWAIGPDVVSLDQLSSRFFRPHLLSAILNGQYLRDVAGPVSEVGLAPDVKIARAPGASQLSIELTNRGGGLGAVTVKVNGRLLPGVVRRPNPTAARDVLTVDLKDAVFRQSGPNQIEVTARNASDSVATTRGLGLTAAERSVTEADLRDLYVLAIGTSQFSGPEAMNLQFAAKDANDFAAALTLGTRRLFRRTYIKVLASDAAASEDLPIKKNILREFANIATRATPDDTVLLYLAGHGVALGGDQYFYLTQDANSLDLADADLRMRRALSSDELRTWLQIQVKALKQIVVLDTCAAGAASPELLKLADKRELSPDQIRAATQLRDATGSFVLMGSAADKVSYEASDLGQGLLTYALLSAMTGDLVLDGQQLNVSTWFGFAEEQVPHLAIGIGGIQQPRYLRPGGNDFPVALLTLEDKNSITLARPKPRVIQPMVVDANLNKIPGLTLALRARLRELGRPVTRGTGGPGGRIVYLDGVTGEIPKGIEPRIQFAKDGPTTVRLFRDDDRIDMWDVTLPVDHEKAAALLATQIVDAVVRLQKK